MAYPTFPAIGSKTAYSRLTTGSSMSRKPRVLRAGFGGGYELRAGDGINVDQRIFIAKFDNLTPDEADDVNAFLATRKGYLPFFLEVPGEGKVLWTCEDWGRAYLEGPFDTITATFKECFDP